jgi:hypothetical protein
MTDPPLWVRVAGPGEAVSPPRHGMAEKEIGRSTYMPQATVRAFIDRRILTLTNKTGSEN